MFIEKINFVFCNLTPIPLIEKIPRTFLRLLVFCEMIIVFPWYSWCCAEFFWFWFMEHVRKKTCILSWTFCDISYPYWNILSWVLALQLKTVIKMHRWSHPYLKGFLKDSYQKSLFLRVHKWGRGTWANLSKKRGGVVLITNDL